MSSNGTSSTLLPSISPPPSPSQQTQPPLPSVTPPTVPSAGPSPPPSSPSNPSRPADPPSSAPPASPSPAPSSNPPSPPPSSNPPSPSSRPPSSTPPASSPPASETRTVTAPSATPSATDVQTSVIFITPSQSVPGQTSVIVITTVLPPNSASRPTNSLPNTGSPSSTNPTQLQGAGKDESSGLSTGGKTAIAVVIPVVAVALLVLGAILFWRKRKQRKNNEDERRKEVEEYGFNPNHDPTLPAVGTAAVMTEDSSGYRGWGNTQTSSNRKASTTLTSGMTYSDSNSNPGGYASPHSPTNAYSDGASNDPLMNGRRETMDSDGIGALGAAPTANNSAGVHRGPSNASSSYSAGNRSDNSGEYPGMPTHNPQDYYDQGYYQEGPYGGNNAYGGGQQPIIRDVSARRNTRIENPSVFPQQGNSGVSTNF